MDTVILAAGRGARLDGIAAPFHKPLLIVNGLPLIVDIVRSVRSLAQFITDRTVVVVAPENAQAICAVLAAHDFHDVQYVIQPRAHGPGDALRRGLLATDSNVVSVLMADNVISRQTLKRVAAEANPYAVSYVRMTAADAERFTRLNRVTNEWDERVPVTDDHIVAGSDGEVICWVGPLIINRKRALSALTCLCELTRCADEILIGPKIRQLVPDTEGYELVEVDVTDIGLPEMWT